MYLYLFMEREISKLAALFGIMTLVTYSNLYLLIFLTLHVSREDFLVFRKQAEYIQCHLLNELVYLFLGTSGEVPECNSMLCHLAKKDTVSISWVMTDRLLTNSLYKVQIFPFVFCHRFQNLMVLISSYQVMHL